MKGVAFTTKLAKIMNAFLNWRNTKVVKANGVSSHPDPIELGSTWLDKQIMTSLLTQHLFSQHMVNSTRAIRHLYNQINVRFQCSL